MLLNTGTPSAGQPVPVVGWQLGDEKGRVPTSVIPGPAAGRVPAGMQVGLPPGVPPYGSTKPEHAMDGTWNGSGGKLDIPCGMTVPGGMKYSVSALNGPQVVCAPPGPVRTLFGLAAARLMRPRQV